MLIEPTAYTWMQEVYGPDAKVPLRSEYTDGAAFGANFALEHLARPRPGLLVRVTRIHIRTADSDAGCVAFATCHAVWRALEDPRVNAPQLTPSGAVFEAS